MKVKANKCFKTLGNKKWESINRLISDLFVVKLLAPEGYGLNSFKFDVQSKTFGKNPPRKKILISI